jgi:hypothetical protein
MQSTTRRQGCQMICFQTENPNLELILEGLGMGKVRIRFGHLEYIKAIW